MSSKASSLAFSSFSPGPDGVSLSGPIAPMASRMRTGISVAAPNQQFTPDQQWFRDNAAGRWQSDFDTGAHAHVYARRQDSMGTTDTVHLDSSYNPLGADSYLDLGGQGGRDTAAGRP